MIRNITKLIGLLLITFLAVISVSTLSSAQSEGSKLEGRWDLTLTMDGKEYPSWLEVEHSGIKTLVGRFVYLNGSARPVSKVVLNGDKFTENRDLEFEGAITPTGLAGTMVFVDGKKYNWTGVRAPKLKRTGEPVYGEPIMLLNGVDLKGWHAMGPNQWKVENGILKSEKSGSNLVTDATFNDFKLHIEFRYQKGSNSGVYLRGRYEVQIMDTKGMDPWVGYLGAIYGFLTPNEMVAKDPGVWQSYDITLIGRTVTIVGNNKTIIWNQEIPGITGGALNSKEGEPGPIYLQGDHGPIEFRNIILTPIQ